MSIHLTQLVWKTELNLLPSEHHVLLCLANFANDKNDLLCCPKISTIAKYCHLSSRQTIRIIKQLSHFKIITKLSPKETANGINSNNYLINEAALKGEIQSIIDDMMSPTMCHGVTCSGDMVSHNNVNDYNQENKKENIKRKEKELLELAKEVINFLRKKTGRNYRYVETTLKPIMMRLKEGISVQQCKQVIARKHMEWGHKPELEKYLRPSTLFSKSNFYDKYLPEIVTADDKKNIIQGIDIE
jgi:uncharacterized phage protein (TIGR02220 family)